MPDRLQSARRHQRKGEVYARQTPHAYATVTRALRDYSMMIYPDESARPNRRYYYRVCAVDEAGQAGEFSDEVSAISEIKRLTFAGSTFFFDSALVDIRPMLGDGSRSASPQTVQNRLISSKLYSAPFAITTPTRIKAALFYPGQQQSAVTGDANFMRSLYPAAQIPAAVQREVARTGSAEYGRWRPRRRLLRHVFPGI